MQRAEQQLNSKLQFFFSGQEQISEQKSHSPSRTQTPQAKAAPGI